MYDFSDPENSDDDDELTDGFYFGSDCGGKEKSKYVLEFSTETESKLEKIFFCLILFYLYCKLVKN